MHIILTLEEVESDEHLTDYIYKRLKVERLSATPKPTSKRKTKTPKKKKVGDVTWPDISVLLNALVTKISDNNPEMTKAEAMDQVRLILHTKLGMKPDEVRDPSDKQMRDMEPVLQAAIDA